MARSVTLRIRLRDDVVGKCRRLAGLELDTDLAKAMDIDPSNVSRVLRGLQAPSTKFMAGLLTAFPGFGLDDLFEVVSDNTEEAA